MKNKSYVFTVIIINYIIIIIILFLIIQVLFKGKELNKNINFTDFNKLLIKDNKKL